MPSEHSQTELHGYLDGELDAISAANFEKHLESCADCKKTLAAEEALRKSIQKANLYERAPESLRMSLLGKSEARSEVRQFPAPRAFPWRWLAVAAVFLFVALVGWNLLRRPFSLTDGQLMAASFVDAHLRSLQPGHLTDVESTDQHTVKPWFLGKLDFSPPVDDLAPLGFPLVGGRLDSLAGRPVAALIYQRRQHPINVFVWPASDSREALTDTRALRGFQVRHWTRDGMAFWAVSDLNDIELDQFAQALHP